MNFFCRLESMLKARSFQGFTRIYELTYGKKVALIGNAKSIFKSRHGEIIDSHDVIIRLNRGYISMEEFQGSSTNILALSVPLSCKDIMDNFDPELIYWLTPKWWKIPCWKEGCVNRLEVYPFNIWKDLSYRLGARPTTGCMMIDLLDRFLNPEEVNIFGFDFFMTPSLHQEAIPQKKCHNFSIEKRYVLDIISRNNKFLHIKG